MIERYIEALQNRSGMVIAAATGAAMIVLSACGSDPEAIEYTPAAAASAEPSDDLAELGVLLEVDTLPIADSNTYFCSGFLIEQAGEVIGLSSAKHCVGDLDLSDEQVVGSIKVFQGEHENTNVLVGNIDEIMVPKEGVYKDQLFAAFPGVDVEQVFDIATENQTNDLQFGDELTVTSWRSNAAGKKERVTRVGVWLDQESLSVDAIHRDTEAPAERQDNLAQIVFDTTDPRNNGIGCTFISSGSGFTKDGQPVGGAIIAMHEEETRLPSDVVRSVLELGISVSKKDIDLCYTQGIDLDERQSASDFRIHQIVTE